MKKFLVILAILTSCHLRAQSFRYGGSFAPAVSWWIVEGDNYVSSGNKVGIQIGGLADITLGDAGRFAFQTGLNFTTAPGGFEQNPDGPGYQGKAWDFKVTTLDLPLLMRLRSDELGKAVLFVHYGLTLGFTLGSEITVNDGKPGGNSFEYESVNTSLSMGTGFEYLMNEDMALVFTAFFQNGTKSMVLNLQNQDNDSRYFPQQIGLRAGILF